MRSPEETVQLQLNFYNEHNLDGFVSTYHDDIKIANLIDNTTILVGKAALREKYYDIFHVLKVHAEIKNRMVIGNKIIDYENVTGLKKDTVVEAVAIYEVQDELIKNVWFVYK